MTRRRLLGLDLDGWHDRAARDWDLESEERSELRVVDGGIAGVAVRMSDGTWIGGPQAELAPHGRGLGWGKHGSPDRRRRIGEALASIVSAKGAGSAGETIDHDVVLAAARALSRAAEEIVVTLSDLPSSDEGARGRLLRCLRALGCPCRLLWRPVAAFLGAPDLVGVAGSAKGERFRMLIHAGNGIEVQTLTLREDSEHPGHLAPERDGYGSLHWPELGLSRLADRAEEAVRQANAWLTEGRVECSRLGLRLLLGEAGEGAREILRRDNGSWAEAVAPSLDPESLVPSPPAAASPPVPSARRLLLTPLAPALAGRLREVLSAQEPGLELLPPDAAARGALRAARLIAAGLPHYFDRLAPIRLAVMGEKGPYWHDLVERGRTLPANREYVSPLLSGFQWQKGRREIDFYVLKGSADTVLPDDPVRHWRVNRAPGPQGPVRVELRLRQTPGQSWARLTVTSSDWEPLRRAPVDLDWETLGLDPRTPDAILAALPRPTVPERVVDRPHLVFWTGGKVGKKAQGSLAALLKAEANAKAIADVLDDRLEATRLAGIGGGPPASGHVRPVGTDGDFPPELPEADRAMFLQRLERETHSLLTGLPPTSNDRLRLLTWAFTLCPGEVQDRILEAIEAEATNKHHPWLDPARALTVLIQGGGRSITGEARCRRFLRNLAARKMDTDTLGGLTNLLTTRPEAPRALDDPLVGQLAEKLSKELDGLAGTSTFAVRFRNTLLALAGLFRYREVRPWALVREHDPVAATMHGPLRDIRDALADEISKKPLHAGTPRLERLRDVVDNLLDYLDGGGDANILYSIGQIDENDDDGDPAAAA